MIMRIFLLFILCCGVGCSTEKLQETITLTNSPQSNLIAEKLQTTIKTNAPEWNLVLVNKSNKLSPDYKIKTEKFRDNKTVDARILPFLTEMFADARKAGIKLQFISGYRSQDYQKNLYENRVKGYMEKGLSRKEAQEQTELYLAPPGTSEHSLGLACDITSEDWGGNLVEEFETTKAFAWLISNCTNYGFILRYPKGKEKITQINYEPWHYRYVGREAADVIMQKKITLEEFLNQTK